MFSSMKIHASRLRIIAYRFPGSDFLYKTDICYNGTVLATTFGSETTSTQPYCT
jgi:hypothetical protein